MPDAEPPPRLLPALTEANTPFWTRGRRGELVILRNRGTGAWVHPPELAEPGDDDLVPETVSGRGTVLTYTVNHHSYRPGVPVPYVIALVELAEDASIRLPTNIVGCEPEDVHIGMPVRAMFEEWGDLAVPLFEPER